MPLPATLPPRKPSLCAETWPGFHNPKGLLTPLNLLRGTALGQVSHSTQHNRDVLQWMTILSVAMVDDLIF